MVSGAAADIPYWKVGCQILLCCIDPFFIDIYIQCFTGVFSEYTAKMIFAVKKMFGQKIKA